MDPHHNFGGTVYAAVGYTLLPAMKDSMMDSPDQQPDLHEFRSGPVESSHGNNWFRRVLDRLTHSTASLARRIFGLSPRSHPLPPPRYRPNPLLRTRRTAQSTHATDFLHFPTVDPGDKTKAEPDRDVDMSTPRVAPQLPSASVTVEAKHAPVADPNVTSEILPAPIAEVESDTEPPETTQASAEIGPDEPRAILPEAINVATEQAAPNAPPAERDATALHVNPSKEHSVPDQPDETEDSETVDLLTADLITLTQHGIDIAYLANTPQMIVADTPPPAIPDPSVTEDGRLDLSAIWRAWLSPLDQRQRVVLTAVYGLDGEDPLTLVEIGDELDFTRERARQIREQALDRMREQTHQTDALARLLALFSDSVQHANNLMTPDEFETALDEHTVWDEPTPRPKLVRLLCAWLEVYQFNEQYQVACHTHVRVWLENLHKAVKRILRRHKSGLTAAALFREVILGLPASAPDTVRDPAFLRKALTLFNDLDVGHDGIYRARRKRTRTLTPHKVTGWLGRPGTHLHAWEQRLRAQIEQVAWIGQIRLSEAEFAELCTVTQAEAREPNYLSKVQEGQPARVPAAVFITSMVFAARYSQQDADEFWVPYLRSVWNVEYTQAFMTRCRKRFVRAVAELEQTYHLEFPRATAGDVVAPVYRHALLPRYVQSDFAAWLRDKWRDIVPLADTPALLLPAIEQDPSFPSLSRRLQTFIQSKNSRDTAANLIADMASAISLHVTQGESVESIATRLAETPIKQELWAEISRAFISNDETASPVLRISTPRVKWVWNLTTDELNLRVQNIVLSADRTWEGEPDRLVWIDTPDADPTRAAIEIGVAPLRLQTGERVVQEVLLSEPDGPLHGQLILLTDMDEAVLTLPIPPQPADPIQFFRPTQQNTFGLPVHEDEVSEGAWWICANSPLRIVDEDDDPILPDRFLTVPYPLDTAYEWAAQVTLTLPVKFHIEDDEDLFLYLEPRQTQDTALQPMLEGDGLIQGLAAQNQPAYTSTSVTLTFAEGGARLAKQTSLWIQRQDGWRWACPLMTMLAEEQATLSGDTLSVHLAKVLQQRPGGYTMDVRASLQSVLPAPLTFAVIPDLRVETPSLQALYSPAQPFEVFLYGLLEHEVVPRMDIVVTQQSDGALHVAWRDLHTEPCLLLRFGKTEIPLEWSPPRAEAWLEPAPQHPFLTLEELRGATLHVVTHGVAEQDFHLVLAHGGTRRYALSRGRAVVDIDQDQLPAMLRRAGRPQNTVTIHVGPASWTLCDVRERPDLSQVSVTYDAAAATVRLDTGLRVAWPGECRVLAESMSNPFAPKTLLATRENLQPQQIVPVSLAPDSYRLVVELDGAPLPLNETITRFEVGEPDDDTEVNTALIAEIRSGKVISQELAEDFILLWAELAEEGRAELTPTTLYQLATVPGFALANFLPSHLDALWPTLRALREAQDDAAWIATRGLLPAWILLPNPLIFRTLDRGYEWPVYPLTAAHGGLTGKGYGIWPLDGMKVQVFVQWHTVSGAQVLVEAGIPDQDPLYWEKVDLLDTYGVYYCPHCGRLVGEKGRLTLPDGTIERHRHGRKQTDLKVVNGGDVHSDFQLLVDCLDGRRGKSLLDIYYDNDIRYPPAQVYLPVPEDYLPAFSASARRRMDSLVPAVLRYGNNSEDASPWASAARLLNHWHDGRKVGSFGQGVTALAVLLRTAAYYPPRYKRLLQDTGLPVSAIQDLLVELDREAPTYLQWGITWAELLMRHSPGFRIR